MAKGKIFVLQIFNFGPFPLQFLDPPLIVIPVGYMVTPLASLMMTSPAATSQQWIPYSKYASAQPEATIHMLRAAEPIDRNLHTCMYVLRSYY